MKTPKRTYALISGIALIIMAVAAGYAYGYVQNSLIVDGNPSTTLKNLNNATGLFGSAVIGWFIILITDLLVAWGLYKYFTTVNSKVAAVTGLVRAFYSLILAVAIYQLIAVWQMLYSAIPDEIALMNLYNSFEKYWSLGLIVFGLHLIGLGYLSLKSNSVPKWLGWLLYFAGISYSLINGVKALIPNATDTIAIVEMSVSGPMAIAELGLAIWLIWKGGKK